MHSDFDSRTWVTGKNVIKQETATQFTKVHFPVFHWTIMSVNLLPEEF